MTCNVKRKEIKNTSASNFEYLKTNSCTKLSVIVLDQVSGVRLQENENDSFSDVDI